MHEVAQTWRYLTLAPKLSARVCKKCPAVMSLHQQANQRSFHFPATTDSWSLMRPSPSSMVSRDSRPSSTVTVEMDFPPAAGHGSSIWKPEHVTRHQTHEADHMIRVPLSKVPDRVKWPRTSWSNPLKAEERCFGASFLTCFSVGCTAPSFTRGQEVVPSHNSLGQQHLWWHSVVVSPQLSTCYTLVRLSKTSGNALKLQI